ncbi:ribonuclease P protein subunit p29 [Pseudomassariella vexata]|uniref:Ribonuclease P protein subunit n=1 Tax=Pseudomassariella vexata TaxID=1141098 RepID=A0A1Y2DK89_9PEZI|nr:ribonuclease P protein subunit p29 [Pseudomassariella vexata]ORY59546.1 ribonuclease P protein subunit p29 [Pseudomassariella vexata]
MASQPPFEGSLTQELLSRAHSPSNTSRIYNEKIKHRSLLLRPSSPPPSANSREARRKALQHKEKRANALKPKPLSSRERRKLGLHNIPKEGQKYEIFAPLNRLWVGYIREILGSELYMGVQVAGAKLSAADFHGAEVEVSRSGCPSRVGIKGIVVKDSKFAFQVITETNEIKLVPKEATLFRVKVPTEDANDKRDRLEPEQKKMFIFEIHGDQFQHRSADRSNKKFRAHFSKKL